MRKKCSLEQLFPLLAKLFSCIHNPVVLGQQQPRTCSEPSTLAPVQRKSHAMVLRRPNVKLMSISSSNLAIKNSSHVRERQDEQGVATESTLTQGFLTTVTLC
jgi:hypothetical protein